MSQENSLKPYTQGKLSQYTLPSRLWVLPPPLPDPDQALIPNMMHPVQKGSNYFLSRKET